MENAVKALLIAAAVLIAILIISLGLVVYNKASETVNNAGDLSEYEIQQHNEKFTKYEGENVSGADVNAMITTVYNYNLQQEADSRVEVFVSAGYKAADTGVGNDNIKMVKDDFDDADFTSATPDKAPTNRRYQIKCTLSNGMVKEIIVGLAGENPLNKAS